MQKCGHFVTGSVCWETEIISIRAFWAWFNINMSPNQYRESHCGDKTILPPSYLHNGISYTGKMTPLYWIRALAGKMARIHQDGMNLRDETNMAHYGDVIMGAIASQITSLTVVYSTVYSDADQRKHQSSASLAFVREIHRGPVNSPHKWPVTRKMFPFDDVIMQIKVNSTPSNKIIFKQKNVI